ncbi:CBS domain-containing protein [Heyndrickxia ginsengihumi]|uniref:CBS domain-containing protein n=1 Tax=Heyndrickxia ginsengihumi TaxID=363870 RepID=A0A0A6VCM8_9BACI|nr:CBS domain-containing protein [Heyndrickxia ginsengihumi]KHD85316.1 CBS domain-containing protein YhcV [Heyndrickxia ginsengihumi]MBE6184961.1 CBS domain-containing protein [Bacillus sp. (in: firmicutes)]NEY21701.1 CBS domain-containing protein [Heyndrickxia ginsengihumi]
MTNSIRSLMSKEVISVQPNQTVQEAAQLMRQHNLGAIPVVENGQVKGMLTDRDITLRLTAKGADANVPVSSCMTNEVIHGTPDMDVHEASQVMAQHQVRRLPIVENNQLVGFVSLGDLAVQDQYQNEAGEALSNISTKSSELH